MRMAGLSFVVLALGLGFSGQAAVAQGDVFSVTGIEVDRTADSAAKAREAALADGHRLGLRRMFEKLVPRDQQEFLPTLPLSAIYPIVVDFDVSNERSSAVRYLADLAFRFRGEKIRSLLRREEIPFAVTRSKPVLLLPVYGAPGEERLWDDNPWYETWAMYNLDGGLVPLMVPLGDLGDVAQVNASDVLAADSGRLRPLADRYGAEGVLISHAVSDGDAEAGTASITLTSFQLSNAGQGSLEQIIQQGPEETFEDLLARAAQELDAVLQEQWKLGNLLDVGNQREIEVIVVTPSLGDWIEIKQRLGSVASIDKVKLTALSRSGSSVDLGFVGNEQQLTRALAQRDLILSLNIDSEWELYLSDQAPRRSTPQFSTPAAPLAAPSLPSGTIDSGGVPSGTIDSGSLTNSSEDLLPGSGTDDLPSGQAPVLDDDTSGDLPRVIRGGVAPSSEGGATTLQE